MFSHVIVKCLWLARFIPQTVCAHPLQCDEIAPHIHARVQGDGNCLFHDISRHLTGTESNHYAVRRAAIQYLKKIPSLIEYILAGVDAPIEPKTGKHSGIAMSESISPTLKWLRRMNGVQIWRSFYCQTCLM